MDKPLWEVFPELVAAVREDHRKAGALVGTGHDFMHALMVAQYASQIADSDMAELGWAAGICHNSNRLFKDENDSLIGKRVRGYLDGSFNEQEINQIIEAVMNHPTHNSPADKLLTIILKDADKLANLGGLLVIRCGQFQPNLPPVNPLYLGEYPPGCNYRNPGSIYRDLVSSLEWEEPGWFRIPKAIELAKPLFAQLRSFLDSIASQLQAVGLIPYPFPGDFEQK